MSIQPPTWNQPRRAAPRLDRSRICVFHGARAEDSLHNLVEEVRQPEVPAGGDRLVVNPLADRQVEYSHSEGREDDRTGAIDGSAFEHDVGKRARHETSVTR